MSNNKLIHGRVFGRVYIRHGLSVCENGGLLTGGGGVSYTRVGLILRFTVLLGIINNTELLDSLATLNELIISSSNLKAIQAFWDSAGKNSEFRRIFEVNSAAKMRNSAAKMRNSVEKIQMFLSKNISIYRYKQ